MSYDERKSEAIRNAHRAMTSHFQQQRRSDQYRPLLLTHVITSDMLVDALTRPARFYGRELLPALMSGTPFRAGATHVTQFSTVAVAHVLDQVTNDVGKVRN